MGTYATVRSGSGFFFTAGITPRVDGSLIVRGRVGIDLDDEATARAATIAAENVIKVLDAANITDVEPLSMTVYIASDPSFTEHTRIADLCTKPLGERFGSIPARAAVGVTSLPGGAPIELSLSGTCSTD